MPIGGNLVGGSTLSIFEPGLLRKLRANVPAEGFNMFTSAKDPSLLLFVGAFVCVAAFLSGPAAAQTPVQTVWVNNPATGVNLYCHVHRPPVFNPSFRYPAIVLAPGGNAAGTMFDSGNVAQAYADLGFIVMHFDPDGRGLSTNGGTYVTEDYCGYLQQEGMRRVLLYLAALPESDNMRLGIVTNSYGITLAAGVTGRFRNQPCVKFIMDWEGPADRTDTGPPGGHVPHDPNDDAWWYEREPTNFIGGFNGYYLRVQSVNDHVQADNLHAVKLLNAATNTSFGGFGECLWTRCNSETGVTNNLPNAVYSTVEQPEYLPETINTNQLQRQYVMELASKPPLMGDGDVDCDGDVDFFDIDALVTALSGPAAYDADYPTCRWLNGDCDGNGVVNFFDIDPFIALLGS